MTDSNPHPFYGQAHVQLKTDVVPMTREEVSTLLFKKCPKTMRDALYDEKVKEIPDFFLVYVCSKRYTRTLRTEVLRVFPNAEVRLALYREKKFSPTTHVVVIPKEAV